MSEHKKNIALFTPMLENEYSSAVLDGAAKGAEDAGVNLIVFPMWLVYPSFVEDKVTKFRFQYNTLGSFLSSHSIDGAIIEYGTIISTTSEENRIKFLNQIDGVPVILLAETVEGYNSNVVSNSGLEDILNHVYNDHNCRKIAFISGPKNNQDAQERLDLYASFVLKNGLNLDESWIAYGDFSVMSENVVEEVLRLHPDAEALVCANDHMAIAAYKVLERMGKVLGKDIIVTGFDNIPTSEILEPPLTTVDANTEMLAYEAVFQLIGKKEKKFKTYIPSKMILRKSCGCTNDEVSRRMLWELNSATGAGFDGTDNKIKKIQLKEGDKKKSIEVELGNIMRELVYAQNNDYEWYQGIVQTFKRLGFDAEYILLYKESVKHENKTDWIQPEIVELKAFFEGDKMQVYENDEQDIIVNDLFNFPVIRNNEKRYDMVVIPLFFRSIIYGFIAVKGDYKLFQLVYQIASQISSSLHNISILKTQEMIKEELAKTSQYKSMFLANMSHEIRTPINAVMGMTEMILRESDDSNILRYANNIENATKSLLSIVNDILDFSKIEANKMSLVESEYELKSVIDNAATLIAVKASDKKIDLIIDYDDSLPAILQGDNLRIGQILLNILSNAVKYTDEGHVKFTVNGVVEGDTAVLTFKVSDTGRGIKSEDLDKLFSNFERIDEKRNRNIEGTGLGMSITLALLKLMGTTLDVQSEYNKGSVFSFVLRQKIINNISIRENELNKKKTNEKELKKKCCRYMAPKAKILVVDDIEMNRVVISCLLSQSQINVEEAAGGIEAIDKYEKNDYDMIFLDHMMPVMDGEETLKNIMKMPKYLEKKTPIIALTANAIAGEKEKYLAMGFDAYLAKPVDSKELDGVILNYLSSDKVIFQEDEI